MWVEVEKCEWDGNNVNRRRNTMYGGRVIANGDGNTDNRAKGYL